MGDRAIDRLNQPDMGTCSSQVFQAITSQTSKDAVDEQLAGTAGKKPHLGSGHRGPSQLEGHALEGLDVQVERRLTVTGDRLLPLVAHTQGRRDQPLLVKQALPANVRQRRRKSIHVPPEIALTRAAWNYWSIVHIAHGNARAISGCGSTAGLPSRAFLCLHCRGHPLV